ncbi:NUDIX domain-containing protein [Actinopolymorpha sp. B9G3]
MRAAAADRLAPPPPAFTYDTPSSIRSPMAEARPARVRLVIVAKGRVALIRRRRAGHTYYVMPGGGVEPGETFVEAGEREAMEELGVEVVCEELLAEEHRKGERFLFYRAHHRR